MRIDLNEEQYDASKLSFAAIKNTLIDTDSGSEVFDGMRAPFFLNQQLVNAIRMNASDIHFEAFAKTVNIRFRIDGVMQEIIELPKDFGRLVTTRIKVVAGLDISEQNVSLSGRFKMSLGGEKQTEVHFRCSVTPTLHGETLNLRVLYLPEGLMDLAALGFEPHQIRPVLYHTNRVQGMILITGPTGAGKTVTLYTLLKNLKTKSLSVYTIEDPVEIELHGINQISVTEENSFANVARALLRQDPDVIMLGEMRDEESCDIAVRAANTGHLVLSTLHSNSASKSFSRLSRLGLPREDIASVVSLIISQRLLRRLDPNTKKRITAPKNRLLALGFNEDEIEDLTLYQAVPGKENNGYSGRTGIYQVVPLTAEISKLISEGLSDDEIDLYLEKQGIYDLRRSALNKVKQGITDIDEVERIFGYINDYGMDNSGPDSQNQ